MHIEYSYTVAATCRSCLSPKLQSVLKLNDMPPGDKYGATKLMTVGMSVPSSIYMCQNCGHIQMETSIDPAYLYSSYLSRPATTNSNLSDIYVAYAEKIKNLANGGEVLEIGSNDGLFLEHLSKIGANCSGIEPALNLHEYAVNTRKVKSVNKYFNRDILNLYSPESKALVFANHSISNIDNIREVGEVVSQILKPNGVFVLQTFYQIEVLKQHLLENYNHEHLSYFTVTSLASHFKQFGLEIFDAELVNAKGGSIRCFFKKIELNSSTPLNKSNNLGLLLADEKEFYKTIDTHFMKTREYITQRQSKLNEIFLKFNKNKKIGAFGTSIGASVFLNQFDIGGKVDAFFDDDQLRQNLFSPEFFIPVLPGDALNAEEYSICLITAPLYAKNIISKNKAYLERGGLFVTFWPEVKVISSVDEI